jgi:hypothetical protein
MSTFSKDSKLFMPFIILNLTEKGNVAFKEYIEKVKRDSN